MSRAVRRISPFLAVVALQLGFSLMGRPGYALTALCDVVQTLLMAAVAAITFSNAWRSHSSARAFWLLLTAGFGLWALANASWSWVEAVERVMVPNPFGGDVILFIHIAPMLAALALQPHASGKPRFSGLDFGLLLVWWLYLYAVLVIPWQYVEVDVGRYGYSFNLIYLAETATFVAMAELLWVRSRGAWRWVYGNLFGAALLYMLGSQLASLAIDWGTYYTGSLYDVPLVGAIAWFGWTAWGARSLDLQPGAQEQSAEKFFSWPTFLAMAAVLSTPLAAIYMVSTQGSSGRVVYFRLFCTLVAILLMSAMLFVRQVLVDKRLTRLLDDSNESLGKLQRLQTQLVQSEKMASLGRLVAGAAHEINNPLTAISGYAELLRDKGGEASPVAHKIVEQCRRTRALVTDLLTFAQERPTEKKPVQIQTVLESALKLKQQELAAGKVVVDLEAEGELPAVRGDANQILNAFLRIMANAVDAMQANGGGRLAIRTLAANGGVSIEFRDSGPGIKEPARIFDPFYTTKPVGKGTGLGLSVCYGIVQAHEGSITCENNPEGGANFRITFPALKPDGEAAAATSPAGY